MTRHTLRLLLLTAAASLVVACSSGGETNNDSDADTPGTDAGDGDTTSPDAGDDDTQDCTTGTLNCDCDAGACEGELVCEADVCVEPEACTPGDTGCECLGDGTCNDPSDACDDDNVCRPRTDCAGELGCDCDAGACDEGLTCEDGTCTVANGVLVTLTGGDARACDVLVDSATRQTESVVFPAGLRGRHRARGERTAISLIRTEDSAVSGVVAAIVFEGDVEASADDIGAVSATCYDRLGNPVDGVTPTVQ